MRRNDAAAGEIWRDVPYAPALLPEMTDLWVAAWQATIPGIDFEARRGWLVDYIVGLADAGTHIRALMDRRNGAMAGFVTFDPPRAWLDQLVVGVGYQGSGAARVLLDQARALSSGLIRLDVNADNARARAFYAREGFVEAGRGVNPTSGRATILLEWRAM